MTNSEVIEKIKQHAAELHASVNQTYDGDKPYSVHLNMVAENARLYSSYLPVPEEDMPALMFGAYFHDSIEDARLTYRNVLSIAKEYMPEDKALIATEIVYALTNEKGRTRAERADERYYQCIRNTPYAPFVKLCDRLANMRYSFTNSSGANSRMKEVYFSEWEHFLASITSENEGAQYSLPQEMINEVEALFK